MFRKVLRCYFENTLIDNLSAITFVPTANYYIFNFHQANLFAERGGLYQLSFVTSTFFPKVLNLTPFFCRTVMKYVLSYLFLCPE